jgi:hypothetical protein
MSWQWFIGIEGLGQPGSPLPLPLAQSGRALGFQGGTDWGTGRPVLRNVRVSSQSWAPVSGELAASSLSFELLLTGDPADPIASYFVSDAPVIGRLTPGAGDVAVGATSISVTAPSAPPTGVLYIGRDRVVVVDSVSGSAPSFTLTLNPDRPLLLGGIGPLSSAAPADIGHTGCILEPLRRRATADDAPPWPDDRVYARNPRIRGRMVYLYRSDGRFTQLWGIYTLDDVTELDASGLVLGVSATSIVGALGDVQFGTEPVVVNLRREGERLYVAGLGIHPEGLDVVAAKGTDVFVGVVPAGVGRVRDVLPDTLGGSPVTVPDGQSVALFQVVSNRSYTTTNRHPFVLLLAHFGLESSRLRRDWTLTRYRRFVDDTGIRRALASVDVSDWPGVVAGQDGRPVSALRWMADTFLRPLGFGWTTDRYGRLSVASLSYASEDAGLRSLSSAVTLPGRQGRLSATIQADSVQARAGQGVGTAPRVIVTAQDAFEGPTGSVYEVDAAAAVNPDERADPVTILDLGAVRAVRSVVSILGTYLRRGVQQHVIRVAIPADTFDNSDRILPGSRVNLDFPGVRIPQLDGRYGQGIGALVIESEIDQSQGGTQILRVQLEAVTFRLIAPALRVATVTAGPGADEHTLTLTGETPLPNSAYAANGITTPPESALLPVMSFGGRVRILRADMTTRGTYDLVSASPLVVDDDASAGAPVVGDMIIPPDLGTDPAIDGLYAFLSRDRFTP